MTVPEQSYLIPPALLRQMLGRAAQAMSDTGRHWSTDEKAAIADHIIATTPALTTASEQAQRP